MAETKRLANEKLRADMKLHINAASFMLQQRLDEKFGEGKIGFAITLFHTKGPEMLYNSTGNNEDMVKLLRELADRLSQSDGRLIIQ